MALLLLGLGLLVCCWVCVVDLGCHDGQFGFSFPVLLEVVFGGAFGCPAGLLWVFVGMVSGTIMFLVRF